jgi:hypothetical protein
MHKALFAYGSNKRVRVLNVVVGITVPRNRVTKVGPGTPAETDARKRYNAAEGFGSWVGGGKPSGRSSRLCRYQCLAARSGDELGSRSVVGRGETAHKHPPAGSVMVARLDDRHSSTEAVDNAVENLVTHGAVLDAFVTAQILGNFK